MLKIVRRLMAGQVVPQREIDYHRGYYDGVRDSLERPVETVAALEAAAERAWRQAREAELALESDEYTT
jgi:hypothetical protein